MPEAYTNAREGLALDSPMWEAIRHTPLGRTIRKNFSESFKDIFRRVFRQEVGNKIQPQWEEGTLRWAINLLKDDSQQFLEFAQQPVSRWDFSEEFIQRKLEFAGDNSSWKNLRNRRQTFVLSHLLDYEKLGA